MLLFPGRFLQLHEDRSIAEGLAREPTRAYWTSGGPKSLMDLNKILHGCVADAGVLHAAAAELQPQVPIAASGSHA